jgi:hypothetical protein
MVWTHPQKYVFAHVPFKYEGSGPASLSSNAATP